jgi:hypothetical protein
MEWRITPRKRRVNVKSGKMNIRKSQLAKRGGEAPLLSVDSEE